MAYIMVDVEADGPIPGDYSMLSIGAVFVDKKLDNKFYSEIKPITDKYSKEALSVAGFSREETLLFRDARDAVKSFHMWVSKFGSPIFVSDNAGFDWQFVNYYFHHFIGHNPFGYMPYCLSSLYKGFIKCDFENFNHLRDTKHTHNALDDAIGNAEALLKIMDHGMLMNY